MDIGAVYEGIGNWVRELELKGRSANTVYNYKKSVEEFAKYIDKLNLGLSLESAMSYRAFLVDLRDKGEIKTATVNLKVAAVNSFIKSMGVNGQIPSEKRQTAVTAVDELSEEDYRRMVERSEGMGKTGQRDALLMRTLACTGIRIHELECFTVESVQSALKTGVITVRNKGKERIIAVPKALAKELLDFAQGEGYIFKGRNGKPLNRAGVHRRLKKIAAECGVDPEKAHSHSFRHLYAKRFLKEPGADIATLADLLGHSSLETTRVYLKKTPSEIGSIADRVFSVFAEA